jgi:hypothetical protein
MANLLIPGRGILHSCFAAQAHYGLLPEDVGASLMLCQLGSTEASFAGLRENDDFVH